jgi:hypothetical protein
MQLSRKRLSKKGSGTKLDTDSKQSGKNLKTSKKKFSVYFLIYAIFVYHSEKTKQIVLNFIIILE